MFELFEIFNEKNKRVFVTKEVACLPEKNNVDLMLINKYKLKIDGKVATKKSINELYLSVKKG